MKRLSLIFAIMAAMILAVSCGQKKAQKVLVIYYSQTGNTKLVAEEIAAKLGADIEEIVAVNPYDGDFMQTIERCMKEREEGVIPEIKPLKSKIAKYDVIFLGYPVWFGTVAPPVATFLKDVDLSGKTIVPFCTFGSGGLESSLRDLEKAQPNALIMNGYGVRAARLEAMPTEVDQFLKENGFIPGDYIQLGEFTDLMEVTPEEEYIFIKATDNYPMLHAKAKLAGKRWIPNGTEYLFIAEDQPREFKDDMPPAGEMKVYVTVIGDTKPEFTKVVR